MQNEDLIAILAFLAVGGMVWYFVRLYKNKDVK